MGEALTPEVLKLIASLGAATAAVVVVLAFLVFIERGRTRIELLVADQVKAIERIEATLKRIEAKP